MEPQRYDHLSICMYTQSIFFILTYSTISLAIYKREIAGCIAQHLTNFFSKKKFAKKSFRAISTARLNTLLCVHRQPINVVVYNDPIRKSNLVASFALRCFQRLSLPDADTQRCAWRHNWYTGGQSVTVLSY